MIDLIEVECLVNEKIIIESLSRCGIPNKKEQILYPSAYLYKKDDKTYLSHFKEILVDRDNGFDNISQSDLERRNSIIFCLFSWELINVNLSQIEPHDSYVFILPFAEKKNWKIYNKIRMGY